MAIGVMLLFGDATLAQQQRKGVLFVNHTALIIGATGGIGGETARALIEAGWTVRALARDPKQAARRCAWLDSVEWIGGDALNQHEVVAAASGVQVIVHAANPPGYRNWHGLALPMLESSIAAASAAKALLVLPGTIYNYGPDAFPLIAETAAQRPLTRKGKIRVAMERRLEQASRSGVRVLIVRAGDFFGPNAGNNWFSQGLVKPGKPLGSVTYPGKPDVAHAWAYLPDLARTIALLIARRDELQPFDVFHFSGHSFQRGVELAEAVCAAANIPTARISRFPWLVCYLLAPFIETMRELIEMRYLWHSSVLLDNRKLVAFLGEEPSTSLGEALHTTLAGLGVLS